MISKEAIDQVVSAAMRALDAGKDTDEAMASASAEYTRTSPPSGTPPLRLLVRLRGAFRERGLSVEQGALEVALAHPTAQSKQKTPPPTESETRSRLPGRSVAFTDAESWSHPVPGAELLDRIYQFIRRFVAVTNREALALAAWVLATYAVEAFDIAPILVLRSPMRRCGKTLLFDVLALLVRRSFLTINASAATIFRVLDQSAPTVFFDEAETLRGRGERAEAIREILNAGHRRGPGVPRCVGEGHEVRWFDVFGFKALAAIGRLWDTVEDRAITIEMRRKRKEDKVERFRVQKVARDAETLRRMAVRWTQDNIEEVVRTEPDLPDFLDDRAQDSWEPILAIGVVAGNRWYERIVNACKQLHAEQEDEDQLALLLDDIRKIFDKLGKDRITSEMLVGQLARYEDRPWGDWNGTKPLTERQLARLLKPIRIKPKTIRVGAGTKRGYLRATFGDAFSRYLPHDPQQAQQSPPDGENPSSANRNTMPSVADTENGESPGESDDVADVVDRKGGRDPLKHVPASVSRLNRPQRGHGQG